MKKSIKYLSLLALSLVVIFSSCRRDNDPSAEEQKIEELSGTWNIVGASVLDEPLTGVSINFDASNTTYSVTGLDRFAAANLNNSGVLGSSGAFSLNENLDVVTLTGGGALTIVSVNKENGDLSLSYSASFPKETDPESTITLSLELQ
jgi:hypothetical protein